MTITIQQLKDLANSMEAKAKEAKDLGVKTGIYQAVTDLWIFINEQLTKKES